MSGFVLIFNRHCEPVSLETTKAMLARLAHRGPDGSHVTLVKNFGMGCQHFWVTPEDVNQQQPLVDRSGRYHILFDGRLDNRPEVLSALGPDFSEHRTASDAELILCSYLRWGDGCFKKLLGPMATAIVDYAEQRVTLARDAIGSRTLFYYLDSSVLVVASEPYTVLAHPTVSPELNEITLAQWYAIMAPSMGTTFFADVSEMLPAHAMTVDTGTTHQWRYWDIDPERRLRYRTDKEYAEHFLHLVKECVHCRLRTTTPISISMSGGYDSTSVAALAALELASRSKPERLLTFSWVFDELRDCDERPAIEMMNRHFNTIATYIPGDDAWPLRDWESWPHNPNMPEGNPYRLLKERLYRAAADAGSRVMLTGGYGDQIHSGNAYWLVDALRDGHLGSALAIVVRYIRYRRQQYPSIALSLFRVVSRLLDTIPGARRIRPRRCPKPPAWLTPYAQSLLASSPPDTWLPSEKRTARRDHHEAMLGTYLTTGNSVEVFHSNRIQTDLRHPYQDRRMIELALALPAYCMYDGYHRKYLAYQAMEGILPEPIRLKPSVGPLGSLYKCGLAKRERPILDTVLANPDALWQRFIRAEDLIKEIEYIPAAADGARALIPWFCVSMELWHSRCKRSSTTGVPSRALP